MLHTFISMCISLKSMGAAIFSCMCGYKRETPGANNPWVPLIFKRSRISRTILQGNAATVVNKEGFDDVEFSWRRLSETCRSGRILQHRLLREIMENKEEWRLESLQHERVTDSLEAMQELLAKDENTLHLTSKNSVHYVRFAFQRREEAVLFLLRFRRLNIAYSGVSPV